MQDSLSGLEDAVASPCIEGGLLPKGAKALLGVSGGSDSVALLVVLDSIRRERDTGWRLIVGHVSHGTGPWDHQAIKFVESLAQRLDLPFQHDGILAGYQAKQERGESVQMMERRFRHQFLHQMAQQAGANHIVLAHTMDDQAETVLMRAASGHWLSGLAAIPTQRETPEGPIIARPLIGLRRSQLRDYLKLRGEQWLDDPHNEQAQFRRNRVRSIAMPALAEAMGQDPIESLATIGRQVSQLSDWLEEHSTKLLESIGITELTNNRNGSQGAVDSIRFPRNALSELECFIACHVIKQALLVFGVPPREVSLKRVEAILEAATTPGHRRPWDVSADVTGEVSGNWLVLQRSHQMQGVNKQDD